MDIIKIMTHIYQIMSARWDIVAKIIPDIVARMGHIKGGVEATWRIVQLINQRSGRVWLDVEKTTFRGEMNVEFCDINLSTKDKAEVKKLAKDVAWVVQGLDKHVRAGYKVSLKWDMKSKCFAAYLFGGEKTPNKNKAISARGRDVTLVLASLLYKHEVIKKSDAWLGENELDDDWFD